MDLPKMMIHLPETDVRLPVIEKFEQDIGCKVEIFDGIAFGSFQNTSYGATLSHIMVIQEMLDKGHEKFIIFEDDVELIGDKNEMWEYIQNAPEYDIFLIGVTEYCTLYRDDDFPDYCVTDRFWGTHAYILTKDSGQKIIDYYYSLELYKQRFTPIDWIVNETIQKHDLKALGHLFNKKFVRQQPGLISLATGNIR